MNSTLIYKALKKIDKGDIQFQKLKLVCAKLTELGLVNPKADDDFTGYNLTIRGKIFIWDYKHTNKVADKVY